MRGYPLFRGYFICIAIYLDRQKQPITSPGYPDPTQEGGGGNDVRNMEPRTKGLEPQTSLLHSIERFWPH